LKSQFQYLGFHWNSNSIPRNWNGIGIEILKPSGIGMEFHWNSNSIPRNWNGIGILKPSGIGMELELKSVELEWNWNSRELRRNEV
jgi:hypothetical protein